MSKDLERGRLCLTRNESQVIMIGDDIAIRIDRVNGKQVHLSIAAPKVLPVHRFEIWLKSKNTQNMLKLKKDLGDNSSDDL